MKKKTGLFLILVMAALFLAACQANYIGVVSGKPPKLCHRCFICP